MSLFEPVEIFAPPAQKADPDPPGAADDGSPSPASVVPGQSAPFRPVGGCRGLRDVLRVPASGAAGGPAMSEQTALGREDALQLIFENSVQQVADVLRDELGGPAEHHYEDFDALARKVMAAAGWAPADGLRMWDPLAVTATKADLVVVLDGMRATVLRTAADDFTTLERPGHHVDISWGDGGRQPKWVNRLSVSKINEPEGRVRA